MNFRLCASILLLNLLPSPAQAVVCNPFAVMVERLLALGERPVAYGEQDSGHTIYVFANPKTSAWTMLRRMKERKTDYLCIMYMGDGWAHRKPVPEGTAS